MARWLRKSAVEIATDDILRLDPHVRVVIRHEPKIYALVPFGRLLWVGEELFVARSHLADARVERWDDPGAKRRSAEHAAI